MLLSGRCCVLTEEWTSVPELIDLFQRLFALQVHVYRCHMNISVADNDIVMIGTLHYLTICNKPYSGLHNSFLEQCCDAQ